MAKIFSHGTGRLAFSFGKMVASAAVVGTVVVSAVVVSAIAQSKTAQSNTTQSNTPLAQASSGPVVAELFTSQGCSSCPSAEAFFRDLSGDENVLVLEWHVDYWDRLHYGSAGKWKDPFSDASYTERQRVYNQAIRGQGGVYTPQAIINGTHETVGSRRSEIRSIISSADGVGSLAAARKGGKIHFSGSDAVIANTDKFQALFVTFLRDAETKVTGGENHGKSLRSANIVTAASVVKPSSGSEGFIVDLPEDGYGCALLLQEPRGGKILAAQYCPVS